MMIHRLRTQFFALALCFLGLSASAAQAPALIPFPVSYQATGDSCRFMSMQLLGMKGDGLLKAEFDDVCSSLDIPSKGKARCDVRFRTLPSASPESYTLSVTPRGVEIAASDFGGRFNALQTLRQLVVRSGDGFAIACCRIEDAPAFSLRGLMIDVGRNYQSVPLIKDMVRRLSRYKYNTLHLHLTDDPGWRVESLIYPQLNDTTSFWPTRQPGKYYTHQELREIVAFCDSLHIEVIPEIDMPGHSECFRRAMGFDMQSEEGIVALKRLIDEVAPIFPGRFFHIGSDEVRIHMKNFMPEMIAHVRSKGKEMIGWYPGYTPDSLAIRMGWGEYENNKKQDRKHRYIDCNGYYLDWCDSQSGVLQMFFQQPCKVPTGNELAMGSEMCVWTDGALGPDGRILEQYPFYPCGLTFAERIWKGLPEDKTRYMAKLPAPESEDGRAFADFEQRLTFHRDRWFRDVPFAYVRQTGMQWRLIGPFDHKGINDTSFEPERQILPEYATSDTTSLRWADSLSYGGAVHIRHIYRMFNMQKKSYGPGWPTVLADKVGIDNGTCYALTYIESPVEQDIYLMFGINGMWGHTGGYRTSRAPEQGSWDYSGGDLWINDQRVNPPHWPFESLEWTGWGKGRIEIPLTEEGYFFRPPIKIHLQKGRNKVLVRSVFGHWKGDDGERKWFFCCMPVNWDGKHFTEAQGLTYSAY